MDRGASLLRSTIIVFSSSWLTLIISIVRLLFVPAKLGDKGLGQITLAGAFIGFFMVLSVLGTSTYLVRAVARDQKLLDQYVSNALVLRIGMGGAALAILLAISQVLGYQAQTRDVILILGLGMIITTTSNVFESGLQAIGQMSWRAISVAIANVATTGIGITLLLMGADVIVYALCIPLGALAQLGLVLSYYFRKRPIKLSFNPVVSKALLIGGMPLFVWAFLQTAYGQIDPIFLSLLADERAVGWFGVAYQITGAITMIPMAIHAVAMPVLCELHNKPGKDFEMAANRTMISTMLVLVPVAAGVALASSDIIHLLNYPAPFLNAVPVLAIMSLSMPISGALIVLAAMALAIGQEKEWVKISALGIIVLPPVYFTLIWLFQTTMRNGAIGNALGNIVGEGVLLVWAWFVLPKRLRLHDMVRKGAQICGVTAVMSAVVWMLQSIGMPIFVYTPIGAVVYGAAAWSLKLITPGDVRLIRGAIFKRSRRAEALS